MKIKNYNGINYVNIKPCNLIRGEKILHGHETLEVKSIVRDIEDGGVWANIITTDEWGQPMVLREMYNLPMIHLIVKDEHDFKDRQNRIASAYESMNS